MKAGGRVFTFISIGAWVVAALWTTTAHAGNPIQRENARPGTTEWQLTNPAVLQEIEGYASLTSVEKGRPIHLYVNTQDDSYRMDVYRMGWYGGAGGRLILGGIIRKGIRQAMPVADPETGLIECRWTDPYALTTDNPHDKTDWLSGVYLVKLTARPSGKQGYIIFVVREDTRQSDYLFQSSVTTYQAYNNWGGQSLYGFNSVGRPARKVSFNRPYLMSENPVAASGNGAGEFLANLSVPPSDPPSPAGWEYNMVRWLEREGYDVTYSTNIDTHADPSLLENHKAWLSVGHDEYWSWEMRTQIERARDRQIGLGFFSANTCYWQIRLEASPITGGANRTIVAYKDQALSEDPYAVDADPSNDHLITGRWREPPLNRPEELLIGVMYEANPVNADLAVTDLSHWVVSGAGLPEDGRLPGLVGYEADRVFGSVPPDLSIVAHSPYVLDGTVHYADTVSYTWPGGSTVFAAGTMQWAWGLDDFNAPVLRPSRLHPAVQQMTRNVLARLIRDIFPTADVGGPYRGMVGAPVQFDGRASSDADGIIQGYVWDFGDGRSGSGGFPAHTYAKEGNYQVTLTVTDNRGAASRAATTVSVLSPPPSARP
jgi:hypothetical protein